MRVVMLHTLLNLLLIGIIFFSGCSVLQSRTETVSPSTSVGEEVALSKDGKLLTESARYWLKKVEEFREDNKRRKPGGIVMLGDSIIERFPVNDIFPDLPVINRGIGGDKVGGWKYYGLIDRLDVSVYDLKPKKLFILIGINDIVYANTPDEFIQSGLVDLFLDIKRNCHDCKVYVQSVFPTRDEYAEYNAAINKFNVLLKQNAPRFGFTYLDFHPYFLDDKGELHQFFSKEGLHLSPTGYKLWARLLAPYLTE